VPERSRLKQIGINAVEDQRSGSAVQQRDGGSLCLRGG